VLHRVGGVAVNSFRRMDTGQGFCMLPIDRLPCDRGYTVMCLREVVCIRSATATQHKLKYV